MAVETKNEGRRYIDLWCVRLRGRQLYIEGNLLSQDKLPYHSSKITNLRGSRVVVGVSDREYVLEGKMVPRKTAFPDVFHNSEWVPQFISDR